MLEVDEEDSIEDIKGAYHRLILRFHPDKNRGDDQAAERFIAIQQAWSTICGLELDHSNEKYKTINSEEIDYSELILQSGGEEEEVTYVKPCRCGEVFEVYAEDLKQSINTFQCNGCSLYITVRQVPAQYFEKK